MAKVSVKEMDTVFHSVREQKEVSLINSLSAAEKSIENLKTILDDIDSSIYSEFREIAEYITAMKSEVRQLNAQDLKKGHIPIVESELEAVVRATDDATCRIMECAETILTADPSDPAAYHKAVSDNISSIFEACSFQDITGQRITKVIETLDFIDKRVSRFAEKVGIDDVGEVELDDDEKQRAKRKKDLILHGPQEEGEGVSQSDIDDLFA